MTGDASYEETVSDTLGFYPSYLAAVEEHPAYASLAWDETRRVLTAPESPHVADEIARAAVGSIAPAVPANGVGRATELDDTLRFFSFVVFRLGLAIASCRYALDGEPVRRAHARPVEADATRLSSLVEEGIGLTLPQDPDITLHQPADADGRVAELYDRVLDELDTPNVNNIFRALAADSEFLATVLNAQRAVERDRPRLEVSLRGAFATALADADLRPANHRVALRSRGYGNDDIDRAASRIRAFHENLPTLVTTLVVAVTLSEG